MFDLRSMLKLRTVIKTMMELNFSSEQRKLLKVQRSSSVLDSDPEITPMKRIAASMKSEREKGQDVITVDLLTNLVARKQQLCPKTLKLLDGALNAPNSTKG